MLALIAGAVRTRTAQVLAVLVLTALAAAGPWFAVASATRAAAADVAAAPAAQRTVSVREISDTDGDAPGALDKFGESVRGMLPIPAPQPVSGMIVPMTINRSGDTPTMSVAYRDGFCTHVRLDGPCPSGDLEVSISQTVAQQLGLGPGDSVDLRATPTSDPLIFKIVSRYAVLDPAGAYWSNLLFQAQGGLDPAFTPIGTFAVRPLWEPTLTYDVQVPEAMLRGDAGYDLGAVLKTADARLGQSELRLVNATGHLLDTIAADRSTIRVGVLVSMIQILILTWFAIGLAGRYTGRDRRGDAALLKLRGSTPLGMLRLAWGQHLVPLALGAIAGLPLGYLLARALAGPVRAGTDQRTALLLSVAAVAAVLVGGLLVLALLEALVLRLPVAALLRQVTSGRGDWRAGLADLLLLSVAVAAIYQARAGDPSSGLALAAPALVALALALLLARLLRRVADRGGGAAVRAGRLRLGLTAVQVSRRPGSDRVFALVVVAVAMFATALGAWSAERTNRTVRSAAELGAARVLTVQAANRTVLERAVRQVDPRGRQAMAAVVDTTSTPTVLAVDSSRLAAVARWRPEYGPAGALTAAAADEPGPSPLPEITGDHLTVRLRLDGEGEAALTLMLQNDGTGIPVKVVFGPLSPGERTVTAPVTGCTTAPGCRIVRWELTTPPTPDGRAVTPPFGIAVTVRGLTQQNPPATVLDAAALGDIARWQPGVTGAAMDVAAAGGTLRMAVDENTAGLPNVGDDSVAARTDRLGEQGPAAIARFALVSGAIGLLLAAAAVAVAGAADRRTRIDELSALRVQGLSHRTAIAAGWAGIAALILTGLLGGIGGAALAVPLARVALPAFTDGWAVLPPPGPLGAATLGLAGLLALAVLGLAGWLSVLPLVRRLREGAR